MVAKNNYLTLKIIIMSWQWANTVTLMGERRKGVKAYSTDSWCVSYDNVF